MDPASLLEDEEFLPRPKVRDSLPFKVLRLLINSGIQTVHLWKFLGNCVKEKWQNRTIVELVVEEEVEVEDEREIRRKRPKQKVFSEIYDFERTTGVDHLQIEQYNGAIQDVTSEAEAKKVRNKLIRDVGFQSSNIQTSEQWYIYVPSLLEKKSI